MNEEIGETTTKKGCLGGIQYKHPAMGVIKISRITCGPSNLFGSSIRHQTVMGLTICRASVERELSNDWVHGDEELIEVYLSPSQFAEMLTSMNMGDGVPCTIKRFNHEMYKNPELPSKVEQFSDEAKRSLDGTLSRLNEAYDRVKASIDEGKPMTKKGLNELDGMLSTFKRLVEDHLPFVLEQFGEQMEKTSHEARAEVEAFIENRVLATGLETIRSMAPAIEGQK